jgi:hypothetical protein
MCTVSVVMYGTNMGRVVDILCGGRKRYPRRNGKAGRDQEEKGAGALMVCIHTASLTASQSSGGWLVAATLWSASHHPPVVF